MSTRSKMVASAALVVANAFVYWGVAAFTMRTFGEFPETDRKVMAMIMAGIVAWTLLAAGWWLIWAGQLDWTPTRVVWTSVVLIAAFMLAAFIGTVICLFSPVPGVFVGSIAAPLIWVAGTVVAWTDNRFTRWQGT